MSETDYDRAKRELTSAFKNYKKTLPGEVDRIIKGGGFTCSFCGKDQNSVKNLIGGKDKTFICDECVEHCQEIISEEGQDI